MELENQPLDRFYKFLRFHFIKLKDVWKSPSVEIPFEQLCNHISSLGYTLKQEQKSVMKELLGGTDTIHLRNMTGIPIWSQCQSEILEMIDSSTLKLIQNRKTSKVRPTTAKQEVYRPISRIDEELPLHPRSENFNQSLKNIMSSINRERDIDKKLKQTISRNQSEDKFDVLVKMGQANSMLKKMQKATRFQVSQKQGFVTILEVAEDGNGTELTASDFSRRFKHFQRQQRQLKKVKCWQNGLSSQKTNFKGTLMLMLDEKDEVSKDTLNEKISQRDKQLKIVLLETLRLKLILKEQLQLLEDRGVNLSR